MFKILGKWENVGFGVLKIKIMKWLKGLLK